MAEARTVTAPTTASVDDFLDAVPDETRRRDARALAELVGEVTGESPVMWGPSIVGFGTHHYRYESGREGDTAAVGFAPRAANLVLYLVGDAADRADLLARLGRHKTGKGCLYVPRLDAVDLEVLRELVARSYSTATAIS